MSSNLLEDAGVLTSTILAGLVSGGERWVGGEL